MNSNIPFVFLLSKNSTRPFAVLAQSSGRPTLHFLCDPKDDERRFAQESYQRLLVLPLDVVSSFGQTSCSYSAFQYADASLGIDSISFERLADAFERSYIQAKQTKTI